MRVRCGCRHSSACNSFSQRSQKRTAAPVECSLQRAAQKPRAKQPELAACKSLASTPWRVLRRRSPLLRLFFISFSPAYASAGRLLRCKQAGRAAALRLAGEPPAPNTPSTLGVIVLLAENAHDCEQPPRSAAHGFFRKEPPPKCGYHVCRMAFIRSCAESKSSFTKYASKGAGPARGRA